MATIVTGDLYEKLDGQLFELKRQMRQPNGYPFDPERLKSALQALVEGRFEVIPCPAIVRKIKLRIDRSVAPADMILATRCDYIYEWMLTHCPAWKGAAQEEVEVCLIDMGRDWLRDEAFSAIDELGLQRAPDNAPLWTLSKTHPDLQRETLVVDPETVWQDEDGLPCVACVYGHPGQRNAYLDRVEVRWDRRGLVLALSK